MIPTTVAGLAIFVACLGPGYIFIRVEERRRSRISRSAVLEIAELLFVGIFASGLAALVTVGLLEHWGKLNARSLANGPAHYMLLHPESSLVLILLTLALAYLGTWLVARFVIFRGEAANLYPMSAWTQVLSNSELEAPYVTVGLPDGTAVAGDVYAFTADDRPVAERELVISSPEVRPPGSTTFARIRDQYTVLHGDEIKSLGVIRYELVRPKGNDRGRLRLRRPWERTWK